MNIEISKFLRASNYLSASQIYLQGNYFLKEPLKPEHIKSRLLGHWGTCPGINFVYAHMNRAIIDHKLESLFVLGPGHGFPAIQSNLFLEGTLSKYYKNVPRNADGIAYLLKQFSWPYGFPSHSNPTAPGVILEGGELGYALSTAYGSILDNPNLIVPCLIGDGEAETGPTATAWHLNKLIDPATNGAVLPILHLNGYKISGPTFFGRMNDEELVYLFKGYGYHPYIVDSYVEKDIHSHMIKVMDSCIDSIRSIQNSSKKDNFHENPHMPMIVLRTPKGWGGISELSGKKLESNNFSHQVIAEKAKTDSEHLKALETWLHSYKFNELFDGENFDEDIEALIPPQGRRMGDSPHTMGGSPTYRQLRLPDIKDYACTKTCRADGGCEDISSMETIGRYTRDVMELNKSEKNFRVMSPDETYSNKLQALFEVTGRAFVWPHKSWDKDLARDGRVMEMLSEHSLQGLMQGYVLTGRHAIFASYEAFIQIVGSMADQYAKFLNVAREVTWRGDISSLNYILTSSGWRQEHNGFSHQNPSFIDEMLQRQGCFVNIYFPSDANSAIAVTNRCLESKNEINVIVVGKRPVPCWRTLEEAKQDIVEGIRIWDFASDDDPHMVFGAVGDYLTLETLAAISILKEEIPEMRLRFVNISSLSALGMGHSGCRVLAHDMSYYFTSDKGVLINFHGYPQTIKQVLFDYGCDAVRFDVRGYEERGSTTTAFDMLVRNRTDRYHLVLKGIETSFDEMVIDADTKDVLIRKYEEKLTLHKTYIIEHGDDPSEITNWAW